MTRHGITHIVKGLVVLWLALAAGLAQAQTYAYQTDTFNWLAPSAAATTVTWDNTCTSYPNGDDVRAVVNFPGGFTFDFAGTTYTQVRIMSNGMIQFGADAGIHRLRQTKGAELGGGPDPVQFTAKFAAATARAGHSRETARTSRVRCIMGFRAGG